MSTQITIQDLQNSIYRIKGQQVMLDHDLAALYGVATRNLKRSVKRNIQRFPIDFMFRLTLPEYGALRCQIGTLKRGQHAKYLPYAFTEEGVAMLSSVTRSSRAIQVNIAIMRAFVKLRHALSQSRDLTRRVEKLEGKVNMHETDIRLLLGGQKRLEGKASPPPTFKVTGFEKDS